MLTAACMCTVTAASVPIARWTIERPGPSFSASVDLVTVTGGSGWIKSGFAYLDFILRFKFRAVTANAKGAVILRGFPYRPADWPGTGVRIALRDGKQAGPIGEVTAYQGRVENVAPPSSPGSATEWHDIEIRAIDTAVTITVDGVVVRSIVAPDAWPAGNIGLEGREGTLEFRDVTIEPLVAAVSCPGESTSEPATTVARPGNGVVSPTLRKSVKPRFTLDALNRGAGGKVRLQGTVLSDGKVDSLCVISQVDSDLDLQAMAAARRFEFSPGTKDGTPVAVRVSFEIEFTNNLVK